MKAEGICVSRHYMMAEVEFPVASARLETRARSCSVSGLVHGLCHLLMTRGCLPSSLHLEFPDFLGAVEGAWKEVRVNLNARNNIMGQIRRKKRSDGRWSWSFVRPLGLGYTGNITKALTSSFLGNVLPGFFNRDSATGKYGNSDKHYSLSLYPPNNPAMEEV